MTQQMQLTTAALTLALTGLAPAAASAEVAINLQPGFQGAALEYGFQRSEDDFGTSTAHSLDALLTYRLTPNLAVQLEWQGFSDEYDGNGFTTDYQRNRLTGGIGYNITPRIEVAGSYSRTDFDGLYEEESYGLHLDHHVSDVFRYQLSYYATVEEDGPRAFQALGSYQVSPRFKLQGGARWNYDPVFDEISSTDLEIAGRYDFTDRLYGWAGIHTTRYPDSNWDPDCGHEVGIGYQVSEQVRLWSAVGHTEYGFGGEDERFGIGVDFRLGNGHRGRIVPNGDLTTITRLQRF